MHPELWNDLESKDIEKRIEAIEILERNGDGDDVDPLLDLLEREPDQSVRERIVLALENLLPAAGFAPVGRMFRSHDAFVRNAAVDILKKQDISALDHLAALAEDENKDVRKLAIDALSAYRDSQVVEIMKKRFSDPDINVVSTAVEYLGAMKAENAVEDIDRLLLETDNTMLRCTALEALANIGRTGQFERIYESLGRRDDPFLRYSFIKFMGRCASCERFAEYLERLQHDENVEMYAREIMDAIDAVCSRFPEALDDSRFRECLSGLFEKIPDGAMKYELSGILARVSGQDMLEQARKELEKEDVISVIAAIEIIGEHGGEDDINLLEGVLERFDDELLEEAVTDAVERISERIQG